MRGGVSRSGARYRPLKLFKASQEKLDAVASQSAELLPSHRDRYPVGGDLARGTTPLQSGKRQLDAASTSNSLPVKRARLTLTDAHTGKQSVIIPRWVNHANVPGKETLRRSARLHTGQNSAGGEDPPRITQSAPPREPQTEAGAPSVPLPLKRARLPRTNKQLSGLEKGEDAAKTIQQFKPPKPPYTSVPEPEAEERVSPATRSQKRRLSSDDDKHRLKRARLTRENLAQFNKMGKKKGPNKVSASAPPESTTGSTTTKTTSTTTSGFAIQARENGILPCSLSKPPTNLTEIRERYVQPRGTASPTESVYQDYVNTVAGVDNEATMVFEVGGTLLKKYDDKGYKRAFNQAFTGFPKEVGFNNGLSTPQPDFVEGLDMEEYRPFPVHKQVDGAVLYKDNPRSVTLPHLAGEWKGPDGNMKEATLQSGFDGAALTYGRNQALDCAGEPYLAGHAKITTFTTDGTNLNLFAHYAAKSEDGELEYHQYPISSTNLTISFEEFKKGRRQLRNAQDLAREESYRLRDELNDYWKQHRNNLHAIAGAALLAPDYEHPALTGTYKETAQDEDEAGYEIVEQPCQPTLVAPTKSHKSSLSHSTESSHNSSNDSHKRKASSSQTSSPGSPGHANKHRIYWKKDPKTGGYYHKHSDGTVTWLDDDDDGR